MISYPSTEMDVAALAQAYRLLGPDADIIDIVALARQIKAELATQGCEPVYAERR